MPNMDSSVISAIVLCLFAFSLFCVVIHLVIAVATKKKYTVHVERIQRILYAIFIKTNLPVGILATALNAYEVLRYGEIETGLLLCCIFFVLSFIMERLTDKFLPENGVYATAYPARTDNQKTFFTALELLNETAAQKSILLSSINGHNNDLLAGIKATQDNFDTAALLVKDYIRDEKQKNETLAKKIKTSHALFEKLNGSAASAHKTMKLLNNKLSSSHTALVSIGNQETLLADINSTFIKVFNEQSIELHKKIQGILEGINSVAYKCAHFQSFSKPYREIVGLYNVKIESVLKVLDRKKNNLLFEDALQTGKTFVFTEPERAIAELGEAIRIKPDHADSYFYHGMAYEYKDTPDYNAALQEYEKALKLNPNSGVYANHIEKLKLKITTSNVKEVSDVNVTAIKVGNSTAGDTWLTNPGGALYASQMRYLSPEITYNSLNNEEITFYIKIIQPDGSLDRNSDISPVGYTYSAKGRVLRGNGQTLRLGGWGNSEVSTYKAGQWTVEVWYKNVCLRSEKVTINP
jgi:tetratricopeptide (TPR) repeat protein